MSPNGLSASSGLFLPTPVVPVFGVVVRGTPLTPGISTFGLVLSIRAVWICGTPSSGSACGGSVTGGVEAAARVGELTSGATTPGGGGLLAVKGGLATVGAGAIEKEEAGGREAALMDG